MEDTEDLIYLKEVKKYNNRECAEIMNRGIGHIGEKVYEHNIGERRRLWDNTDTKRFKELLEDMHTIKQIALITGWSEATLRRKRRELKIERTWTPGEIEQLRKEYKEGKSLFTMMKTHRRPLKEIREKIFDEGIKRRIALQKPHTDRYDNTRIREGLKLTIEIDHYITMGMETFMRHYKINRDEYIRLRDRIQNNQFTLNYKTPEKAYDEQLISRMKKTLYSRPEQVTVTSK